MNDISVIKNEKLDVWFDGSAICIIAIGSHGDPLDLSENEAIEFMGKLNTCIKSAQKGDAPERFAPGDR